MRSMTTDAADDAPYREAAALYFDAGWTEPLPLPFKAKWPPPEGFTGRHLGPSRADIQAWLDDAEGAGNIAIRLPDGIVGIDVDAYHDGADTLAGLVALHGELPPTWRSTSRDDGSAIHLYRVPPHLAWPGQLGAGIEVIQRTHRYVVCAPSVHPSGAVYRWFDPNGLPAMVPPDPDLLPLLPQAWIDGITRGQAGDPIDKADLAPSAALEWLATNSPATDTCRRVGYALEQAKADLAGPGSAHEAARGAVLRLINLAAEHHAGVGAAITALARVFVATVTHPGRDRVRTEDEARGEWFGLVLGGIQIGAAKPTNPNVIDPCVNPFAGIMPPDRTRLRELPTVPFTPPVLALDEIERPDAPAVDTPLGEVEHSTWWPIDLTEAWDGEDDEGETPTILARSDGARLFYRGQVNGFIGESESGKTWLAYEAVRQVLADGGTVQVYDFEDSRKGAVNRLRALGVDRTALARLSYINPDEPVMGGAVPQAWTDLAANLAAAPDLIVVDGFNAAMGTQGLDMDSNGDVTAFIGLLRKMAATGAAVVTVDHVPKNPDGRLKGGIGAQAKRAGVTGATIRVEVDGDAYPAPGKTGTVRLSVDKDRRGGVREHAEGKHLAMVTIASNAVTRAVQISIIAPVPGAGAPEIKIGSAHPKTMEALTEIAASYDQGRGEISFSQKALFEAFAGRRLQYPRPAYKGDKNSLRACWFELIEQKCLVASGVKDQWRLARRYDAAEAAIEAIALPEQFELDDDYDA